MKVLKEVCDSPWDFTLYKTDEGFVMNVEYSKSAVDYSRSFRLSSEEANQDMEGLKQLSEQMRNNPGFFKDREIIPVVRMNT